jgi:hypothetical protein
MMDETAYLDCGCTVGYTAGELDWALIDTSACSELHDAAEAAAISEALDAE